MRVLRGLLRPLVRTMIARGLTAPVVYGLLKRVYVEVAESHFALDDKPLTDSRIAMLTGVHRKDIRTIRAETDDGASQARRKSALLATVIGQWMTNPEFLDDTGAPRPLPRSEDGFDALVRTGSKDVRPRTVLDELMRGGMVADGPDGLLSLQSQAVVGTGNTADREAFFAANVGDHLAAASENLLADAPPFFERAGFYNQLTAASIDQIEETARRDAQSLLEALSHQSSALRRAQDDDDDTPRQRYRMGIYFYREDTDAAPTTDDKGQDTP